MALLPILSFGEPGQSDEELAKAAQNPIAAMISLPFQNNTNLNIGPNDQTQNILNIQPVWPFSLNDDWNLITRTIAPVTSNPSVLTPPNEGRIDGLGDIVFTAFFSPKDSGSDWIWGVGPAVLLPTATDDALGQDTWGAGLSAVALTMPGRWVYGAVITNVWDISGDANINFLTLQPFLNYNFDEGWYVTTAPIITANWEADSDHKWTVPLGAGFGKIFRIGNQPINAQLSLYNNVVTPDDYGSEWQVRTQIQFLFPK
ncbi:MAG: neuromedin U [Sulfurovum sp.]|nr:neuromedin U [Sulfurovum sp.]